jgi:hypothetical protein
MFGINFLIEQKKSSSKIDELFLISLLNYFLSAKKPEKKPFFDLVFPTALSYSS